MNARLLDLAERAGWTALQAAIGVAVTSLADIPAWWALPVATVLSAAKSAVVNKNKVNV